MSFFIDLFSTLSIVGIWPRFIEPRLLKITELTWNPPKNGAHLDGFKVAHLSDLHFHAAMSQKFLNKIVKAIRQIQPDLILFTGDFLCYSQLEQPERLASFLNQLQAPQGSFCIFGNHDYAQYATLDRQGIYNINPPLPPLSGLLSGTRTLFSPLISKAETSKKVLDVPLHKELCQLLDLTPFKSLNNETINLPIGLNITGLGDLALGRCLPQKAFSNYNKDYPGITLSHNPDTVPLLLDFPGQWILSGHTHGEQIHLPWPKWGRKFTQKLARLKNSNLTRGLVALQDKKIYINRGLGCHKPFRLFSPPEIGVIHISCKKV